MARVDQGLRWQPWGVIVGVRASTDPTFTLEVQRQSSGSTWRTIKRQQPAGQASLEQIRDVLPSSTYKYDYRARCVRDGYTASTWTATVSAAPLALPDGPVIPPAVGAVVTRTSDDVFTKNPSSFAAIGTFTWDNEVSDAGGLFSTDSTDRLTVPYADYYDVTAHLTYTDFRKSSAAGVTRFDPLIQLSRVSTGTNSTSHFFRLNTASTANASGTLTISEQLPAEANDYFKLQIVIGSSTGVAGTVTFPASASRFSVKRVSAYQ